MRSNQIKLGCYWQLQFQLQQKTNPANFVLYWESSLILWSLLFIGNQQQFQQLVHSFLCHLLFIDKMEGKKVTRDQFKLQITACRNPADIKKKLTHNGAQPSCMRREDNMEVDQKSSPTFRNDLAEGNEREALTFSFGHSIRKQMETILNERIDQNLELEPFQYVQCDSFCGRSSQQMIHRYKVVDIFQKFSRFYEDVKVLFETVRVNFKDYQAYLKAQQGYLISYLKIALASIQNKQTEKAFNTKNQIEQLKCKYLDKIKMLEQKSEFLRHNLAEVARTSALEKGISEKMVKKISELTEELQAKNRQILNLQEENQRSTTQLTKFISLANSMKGESSLNIYQQIEKTNTFKQNLSVKKTIDGEGRPTCYKQSAYSTASKTEESNFKDSFSFYTLNTEQNSPIQQKMSTKSSSILQEKNAKNKSFFQSPKPKKDQSLGQLRGAKAWRKPSDRKHSWQSNIRGEEGSSKSELMQRISRLKEELHSEIKELKSERA